MKNLILTLAMNTILTTALSAQDHRSTTPTKNWLAANQEAFGANAPANWLMDLEADKLDIYVTTERALVLVDRSPIENANGAAYLRKSVKGLGGTDLSLVGEVDSINDSLMHGVYSGLLGGTAVLMDQYVELRNDVVIAVVRVITRVNGSVPPPSVDHLRLLASVLGWPGAVQEPLTTKH